jgi:hypothetical protein
MLKKFVQKILLSCYAFSSATVNHFSLNLETNVYRSITPTNQAATKYFAKLPSQSGYKLPNCLTIRAGGGGGCKTAFINLLLSHILAF